MLDLVTILLLLPAAVAAGGDDDGVCDTDEFYQMPARTSPGKDTEEPWWGLVFVAGVVFVAFGMYLYNAWVVEPQARSMQMGMLLGQFTMPCEYCGLKRPTARMCPECKVVAYCSPECQASHRLKHAEVCHRLKDIMKKHQQAGGGDAVSTLNLPPVSAPTNPKGYFEDWDVGNRKAILKDTATYFTKYHSNIRDFALKNIATRGRGLVLVDVSTERFKKLHETCDPLRMIYIMQGAIKGDRLGLFNCQRVFDLLQDYNPNSSCVVAFTNGMNYIERLNAVCPVMQLSFDQTTACAEIRSMTASCLISNDMPTHRR